MKKIRLMLPIICASMLLQMNGVKATTYEEYGEIIEKLEDEKSTKEEEKKKVEEKRDNIIKEKEEVEAEISKYQNNIERLNNGISEAQSGKIWEGEDEESTKRYQALLQSNYILNPKISEKDIEEIGDLQKEIERYKNQMNNKKSYEYITGLMKEYGEGKEKEYQNHINILQVKSIKYSSDISGYDTIIEKADSEIEELRSEIGEKKEERIRLRADSNEMDIDMVWPCPHTTRISSGYGYRSGKSTNYVGTTRHDGIDISASGIYGTSAIAASAGIVEEAGWNSSMGNYVVVRHSLNVKTYYMHGSRLSVSKGDYVEEGEEVLKIGSTGASTGPHLHFAVMVNCSFDNPHNWV